MKYKSIFIDKSPVLSVSARPQWDMFGLKRSLSSFSISIFCWRRRWDRAVENLLSWRWRTHAVMMMKIWRHANPTRITFHLFVFLCEGAHVRAHQRYEVSPRSVHVFRMRAAVLCDPTHVSPSLGCLRAQNNEWASEPLVSKKPLYSSGTVLGGKRRHELNGSSARVRRGTSSRLWGNIHCGSSLSGDQSVCMLLTLNSYIFQPESS